MYHIYIYIYHKPGCTSKTIQVDMKVESDCLLDGKLAKRCYHVWFYLFAAPRISLCGIMLVECFPKIAALPFSCSKGLLLLYMLEILYLMRLWFWILGYKCITLAAQMLESFPRFRHAGQVLNESWLTQTSTQGHV